MFVDHISNYIYVHLMKDFTITEILLAKMAFKKLCARANCSVKHYHADNGQFSDKEFLAACKYSNKLLSFVEVVHTIKMESLKTEINS
jgi:hypothetical protein